MLSKIEPIAAIFCDDIREEQSGKKIIVGAYTGDILVPKDEGKEYQVVKCSLGILFRVNNAGAYKFAFRLSTDYVQKLTGEAKIAFNAVPPGSILIDFNGLNIRFVDECDLSLEMKQEGETEWTSVDKIRIQFWYPENEEAEAKSPKKKTKKR